MADKTGIEWTDATWNPLRGCSRVSDGCRLCYAETVAARFSGPGQPYEGLAKFVTRPNGDKEARWTGEVAVVEKHMFDPIRWQKPRFIFVNSMSDLFHEKVDDDDIDRMFAVMALAPRHRFQTLTKRPERQRDYMNAKDLRYRWHDAVLDVAADAGLKMQRFDGGVNPAGIAEGLLGGWRGVLPNVWVGVSAEDQKTADERIPLLLDTPAAIRWVSAEPLIGPLKLRETLGNDWLASGKSGERRGLDWVVAGGESGNGARPMHPDWVRSLRDQCQAAGVPFFFKQWGEWAPGENAHGLPTRTERTAYWFDDKWTFGTITPAESEGQHVDDEPDLYRLGKKAARRSLDGREWSEFPA
jgi:protein gp37